jgi:hypothetical protein
MRHSWALILLLAFSSCSDRERARDQAAADGHEGVEAILRVAPVAEPIGRGVQTNILAARGKTEINELPRAQLRAEDIVENPALYQQQARQNMRRAHDAGLLGVIGLGALVTLFGILKATGVGGPLVHWVGNFLDNAKQRSERAHAEAEARVGRRMVRVVEQLPPEQGRPIKQQISHAPDHTPEDEKAIRTILREPVT